MSDVRRERLDSIGPSQDQNGEAHGEYAVQQRRGDGGLEQGLAVRLQGSACCLRVFWSTAHLTSRHALPVTGRSRNTVSRSRLFEAPVESTAPTGRRATVIARVPDGMILSSGPEKPFGQESPKSEHNMFIFNRLIVAIGGHAGRSPAQTGCSSRSCCIASVITNSRSACETDSPASVILRSATENLVHGIPVC